MRRLFYCLIFLCIGMYSSAQNRDLFKEYEEFKKKSRSTYDDFKQQVHDRYMEFLRQGWEWYDGESPMPVPGHEAPVVPPVVLPDDRAEEVPEIKEQPYAEIVPEQESSPAPVPVIPVQEVPMSAPEYHEFEFYGTELRVRFNAGNLPYLPGTDEASVAGHWAVMVKDDNINNLLYDCLKIRRTMTLCDWAYFKLTEQAVAGLYPYSRDEAVVMQAYLLCSSGFKLRLGRADDGSLRLLVASEHDVYGYSYWHLDGEDYYLFNGEKVGSLYVMSTDFPEARPMRMTIDRENLFAQKLSSQRILASDRYPDMKMSAAVNENLIAFYDDYPMSYVNNSPKTKWRFYAEVPMSESVKAGLYPQLTAQVTGRSELQAVEMLLNFVQTAFVYEYDDKLWGRDRVFFADESLYYPYCDCEDRSILFSRLVRDILGLDVALIYYPGHLAAAVSFTDEVPGDYVSCNGRRYTICDPTYINASVGMTMPDMDNASAFVLLLQK